MPSKRHHLVPEFYLEFFADRSGRRPVVWVYDKDSPAPRPQLPKDTAIETHFHTVQLPDGTRIQYLHTSQQNVRVGDPVTPESVLGRTGNTGANAIHLHVQARDGSGNFINPDEALTAGQANPTPAKKK